MQAVDSVTLTDRGDLKVWKNDGTAVVGFTPGVSIAPGEYLAVHPDGAVERLTEEELSKVSATPAGDNPRPTPVVNSPAVEKKPTVTGPKVS